MRQGSNKGHAKGAFGCLHVAFSATLRPPLQAMLPHVDLEFVEEDSLCLISPQSDLDVGGLKDLPDSLWAKGGCHRLFKSFVAQPEIASKALRNSRQSDSRQLWKFLDKPNPDHAQLQRLCSDSLKLCIWPTYMLGPQSSYFSALCLSCARFLETSMLLNSVKSSSNLLLCHRELCTDTGNAPILRNS